VKSISADGHYRVTAQVTQSGTPYRLRLPVVLKAADGEIVRKILEISGPATSFQFTSKSQSLRLELDPDGAAMVAGLVESENEDPFAYSFPVARTNSQ
jgi:hypothetical protein